jgi:hypothetical protein
VVNWKACVDHVTPSAKHVEASSSHFGLLVDPDVWLAVAVAPASNLGDMRGTRTSVSASSGWPNEDDHRSLLGPKFLTIGGAEWL